jgi:hypothetical protein
MSILNKIKSTLNKVKSSAAKGLDSNKDGKVNLNDAKAAKDKAAKVVSDVKSKVSGNKKA